MRLRALSFVTLGVGFALAPGCGRTEMGVLVQGVDSGVTGGREWSAGGGTGDAGGAGSRVPTSTGGSNAGAGGAGGARDAGGAGDAAAGPCAAVACLVSLFQTCVPEGKCLFSGGSSPSASYGSVCYDNGVAVSYLGSGTGAGVYSETTVRQNGVLCYSIKASAPANTSGLTYSVTGPGGEEVATGATADKSGSVVVTCKGAEPATVSEACLEPAPDTGACDWGTCVELPRQDAASTDDGPASGTDGGPGDGGGPATPCGALKALAEKDVLTKQRTTKVTFAPDQSWVVLKVRQEAPPDSSYPDQLLYVALPSGEVTVMSSAGGTAEPLGQGGGVLVLGPNGYSTGVDMYENGVLRILVTSGVCAHLATPDGSRLYVIRDCDSGNRGTLDVIDLASGTAKTLAGSVLGQSYWNPTYAVSPSGRYFAFLVQSSDGGEPSNLLHVADRDGKVYTLPSQRGATMPWFASDDLLLFGVGTDGLPGPSGCLRAHVPGSGDTSYALTSGGQATGLHGYKISADQQWLLGIEDSRVDGGWMYGLLYAIRLDGTGANLLSSTLVPHWMYEMGFDSFAWSGDGNGAIYIAGRGNGVWASDLHGTTEVELSPDGWFRAAPLGDQVAIIEDVGDARSSRLRLLSTGSTKVLFSYSTDGTVAAPAFTPDARGLLFVNSPSSGARQLRYFSASAPDSVVLGEWTATLLDMNPEGYAAPLGRYPVDPTGCFTVVDTDLAPGPGTRLVLLPE